ncbi:MAG: hypothetical protein MUC28_04320, partial [Planctomycetes bacterium]|nr:hypothetical protein [Planctomycetota bacterium]
MPEDNHKKIDGITKISKDELIKSRKIVLDSIGESTPVAAPVPPVLNEIGRKVDGLVHKTVLKETTVLSEPRRISDRQKKLWRAEMS